MELQFRSNGVELTAYELKQFLNSIDDEYLHNCSISADSLNFDAIKFQTYAHNEHVLTIGTFISDKGGVI